MVNDPIADMLTRIRNAAMIQHPQVVMPSSKVKVEIAKILTEEGFVRGYSVTDHEPQPYLIVGLKYTGKGNSVITGLERVSKPGRRVYVSVKSIPQVANGLGISILSTPKGVMADHEAREQNVGGEILCQIF